MPAVNGPGVRACMLSFYFHPSYSGSAVQVANLSRHLRDHGIESLVVSANLTGSPRREVVNGLALYRLPVCSTPNLQIPSFWLSLAWFLIRHRKRYDIIHAHGTYQHTIASLVGRWLGKPTILKIAMANSDIAFERQGRLWGRMSRFLVERFDLYVATSDQAYQECLDQGLDASRTRIIPNGVDTDRYRPVSSAQERRAIRDRLGLPEGPIVCYVGIIDRRKNVDGILRVWKDLRLRGAPGHLLLIGPEPTDERGARSAFCEQLRRYITSNGLEESVTLAGQQHAVEEFLRCSDIFFFPSRQEGMPNVLLEAMASGLACIVSGIGGNVDLVEHEVTGSVFDLDDEAGMASCLFRLLSDRTHAKALGAAARSRAEQLFSLRATACIYADLYREMLGRVS